MSGRRREIEIRHIDLIDHMADDLNGVADLLVALSSSTPPFAGKAEELLASVLEGKADALRGLSKELHPSEPKGEAP